MQQNVQNASNVQKSKDTKVVEHWPWSKTPDSVPCLSTSINQSTAQTNWCNICPSNQLIHTAGTGKSEVYWCAS
jgi:hypothetical protein